MKLSISGMEQLFLFLTDEIGQFINFETNRSISSRFDMRLVGLTLALLVAGGQGCSFLEGAEDNIELMVRRSWWWWSRGS